MDARGEGDCSWGDRFPFWNSRRRRRLELNRRIRGGTTSTRDCLRARIVLLRSRGMKQADVAREVGTSTASVNKWSQRFEQQGFDGLVDRSGRGRKAAIAPEVVERVIGKAGSRAPGTRRRSTRTTAAEVGISASSVSRIWRGHGLKPHLRRTFKALQRSPVRGEVLGRRGAVSRSAREVHRPVLRTRRRRFRRCSAHKPGLPLGSGHIRTETHDYHRHGTITLFAAMNYLDGKLIDRLEAKHTHVEWLRFLKQIDKQTPAGVALHVIADNYATHKHAKVKAWLAKHPRFEMHFTPTSSSWLNLVERFFAELTAVIREGSFDSVAQLRREIVRHLAEHNDNPRPYKWVAKGEDILAKINRARTRLARIETEQIN